MKKIAFTVVFGLLSWSAQASLFTDDFNRANTASSTNPALIGSGYAVWYPATTNTTPQFKIATNALVFSGGTAKNISLYQNTIQTANTGGNSFTISEDITTVGTAAPALLYGLCFNVQADGSLYALRINTGSTNVLQFLKFNAAGTATSTRNVAISGLLATSSVYHIEVSSSAAGVFDYTLTGANLGSGLSGTFTADVSGVLSNGYGGVYSSAANAGVSFDNLSITSIPEPATIGMLGLGTLVVLLTRRLRK